MIQKIKTGGNDYGAIQGDCSARPSPRPRSCLPPAPVRRKQSTIAFPTTSHNTGYPIAGDIFANKLAELSKNTMLIDQYPGAQLGQEPQVLQLVKSGDIDFAIISSANAATLSPQAGVMSLHFLFRSEDHLKKSLADPQACRGVQAP